MKGLISPTTMPDTIKVTLTQELLNQSRHYNSPTDCFVATALKQMFADTHTDQDEFSSLVIRVGGNYVRFRFVDKSVNKHNYHIGPALSLIYDFVGDSGESIVHIYDKLAMGDTDALDQMLPTTIRMKFNSDKTHDTRWLVTKNSNQH
jgi:hypothetical protein